MHFKLNQFEYLKVEPAFFLSVFFRDVFLSSHLEVAQNIKHPNHYKWYRNYQNDRQAYPD